MLKKMVMGNFDSQAMDRQMYAAVEFMNAKVCGDVCGANAVDE